MLRIISLLSIVMISLQTMSTEVDSFTARNEAFVDARYEVNRVVQGYLIKALAEANKKSSCDPWTFIDALAHQVHFNFFYGTIEKDLEKDRLLDKHTTKRRKSVYRDFNILEAPGLYFVKFAPLIKVNDVFIGIDKLGHFLDTGHEYFVRRYRKGHSIEELLTFGVKTEKTYFGMATTGIYSHADMAANFDGFGFWEQVTGGFGRATRDSYVKCHDNLWVQHRAFDIKEYVNPAWDEAINLNRYKTEKMQRKMDKRMSKLAKRFGTSTLYQLTPSLCALMKERYGDAARTIVTPRCFEH